MIILDCQQCIEREAKIKHLQECLGMSREFEHRKIKEVVEVDEFIATKMEGHDGNWGRLVDRVKLLVAYLEQRMRERIQGAIG